MDLSFLNNPQYEAVVHEAGPELVLAGAGSGKTGVITNRIIYLIEKFNLKQSKICAVTFTNKASVEMKERVRKLSGKRLKGIFIGTYHSLGLKIIKENLNDLCLEANFTIQTKDDQLAIINEIQKEFEIDNEILPDKKISWAFSQGKNTGLEESKIPSWLDYKLDDHDEPWGKMFTRYQQILRNYNSVDFDDLILIPRDLLKREKDIQKKYHNKWDFFLADEFQDTNPLQFEFLKLLMKEPHNLCAVGDDDQSIYGWRGADIRIILNFKESFPDAKIISLEQNYRSNQVILDLANATIKNNPNRHPKNLWSANKGGENAIITETETPEDEAEEIVSIIQYLYNIKKKNFSDIAILMRTNFQSRPLEESLRIHNIPYHITGGYQFFDRKEVKDILAYLKFFANHADERSLIKCLTFPKKNIGDKTISKLKTYASLENLKLWDVIEDIETCPISLPSSTLSGIIEFRDLTQKLGSEFHKANNLTKATRDLVDELTLEQEFNKQGLEERIVHAKMLNIRDLIQSVYTFETGEKTESNNFQFQNAVNNKSSSDEKTIYEYLQFITILSGDDKDDNRAGKVSLMTLHLAKGLEFPYVFLAGLEDGTLPHSRSIEADEDSDDDNENSLEEERRLFYVGLTRAKERIYLSYSLTKKTYVSEISREPSRFLSELPEDLIDWKKLGDDSVSEKVDTMESLIAAMKEL